MPVIVKRAAVIVGIVLLVSIEVSACVDISNSVEPRINLSELRLLE